MSIRIALALAFGLGACGAASAQNVFTASIDGLQENPPTPSAHTGFGEFIFDPVTKMLRYDITISGVTGGFVAAHIHAGAVGINGGILFFLLPGPTSFSGTAGPFSAAQEAQLKAGTLYCNFHSGAFGSGEIRGQITATKTQTISVLIGGKETPPNPSPATGSGTLTLNPNNTVSYDVTFSGLGSAFTAAHIHDGLPGVMGPIVHPLTLVGPGHLMGTTPALTGQQPAKFRAGIYYVNVHSVGFPAGEIRGQMNASWTPYGMGCPHAGGTATLDGGGITAPGGTVTIAVNNGNPSSAGILFLSPFPFKGTIGFGCPLYLNPAALIPITLPMPPSGSVGFPAMLPPTTPAGTSVVLQYIGDKGGGTPYDTNGIQLLVTN
jgi:hypothetical protein